MRLVKLFSLSLRARSLVSLPISRFVLFDILYLLVVVSIKVFVESWCMGCVVGLWGSFFVFVFLVFFGVVVVGLLNVVLSSRVCGNHF